MNVKYERAFIKIIHLFILEASGTWYMTSDYLLSRLDKGNWILNGLVSALKDIIAINYEQNLILVFALFSSNAQDNISVS